jgi:hypothetical protein
MVALKIHIQIKAKPPIVKEIEAPLEHSILLSYYTGGFDGFQLCHLPALFLAGYLREELQGYSPHDKVENLIIEHL